MIHRIEVATRSPQYPDLEGENVLTKAKNFGIKTLKNVRVVKIYKLEGNLSIVELENITNELLVEKIWQDFAINKPVINTIASTSVEISRKSGVMDTEMDSLTKAICDLGIRKKITVGTGKKYIFEGKIIPKILNLFSQKILMNESIEKIDLKPEKTLIVGSKKSNPKTIPIRSANDKALMALSKNKLWLNIEEMIAIRNYFIEENRDPTDVEIEIFAQTWSEHCSHKIFNSNLIINGIDKPSLMARLKSTTKKINKSWCLSVFKDNAGVIAFDNKHGICGKVETHNSPSAIEPYGGAMTGSGGVFRDIMGCGLGSKVIASTDIFCLAPPNLPDKNLPEGCIHPQKILKEVVRGVKDYGNRMGIPTNNGSLHFHEDYRAKPSVIVGSFGLMPRKYINKKRLKKGDLIISVGGKTGRDGIHGVTFSSGNMTRDTQKINASAVQIGNAIEQKRMFDAILVCRDKNLLKFVQDCGGGGYSSAVSEIVKDVGAKINLDKVPLKYPGLSPWEIWISESQERMILVVSSENYIKIAKICSDYNVEASEIGAVTEDRYLNIYYQKKQVCHLSLEFLFGGCPINTKIGTFKESKIPEPIIEEPKDYEKVLKNLLSTYDICSKEPIVRLYDHEVQGTSVVKPFTGKNKDAPNDASVIAPILGLKMGIAIAHGLIPTYNKIDPYHGATSAIDEAVRNLVSVGVDPTKIALIDNFIWPTPGEYELGDLDRSVDACCDVSLAFKMPFVSGKDSLSSTYKSVDGTVIKIPPTVCISAFAPFIDVYKSITSELKEAGNPIFVLGKTSKELGGSAYYSLFNKLGNSVPKLVPKKALKLYKALHKAINYGLVISAHDLSEGGLGVALAEMCFGGCGADIDLSKAPTSEKLRSDLVLFSESNSRFVVEVKKSKSSEFVRLMEGVELGLIGSINNTNQLSISNGKRILIKEKIEPLKTVWKKPMKEIFI